MREGSPSIFARAARGDADAREQVFALHFDGVYAYLRMVAADPARAEAQAVDVLCVALERPAEAPSKAAEVDAWLRGVALELIAVGARPGLAVAEPARGGLADVPGLGQLLAGVSDRDLATLVRTLEPRVRQAVVLGVMSGMDDDATATVIGVAAHGVAGLKASGLGEITRLLTRYNRETEEIGSLARKHAYHLRPQPGPISDGMLVAKGTRMMVAPGPGNALVYMALKALDRLLEILHLRHGGGFENPLDDDVGEISAPKALPATPGQQAFDRPKSTPSMREYRTPKATPGMAGYRQPKTTPSTERLSSPARTGQARSMGFGAARRHY